MKMRHALMAVAVLAFVACGMDIVGGKESDNKSDGRGKNGDTSQPKAEPTAQFTLDYDQTDEPQVLKSEVFLKSILIKQYHVKQAQPTVYAAKDIARVVMVNHLHPDTKEWSLGQIDIHFRDGSMKSEHAFKVWNVSLDVTHGEGAQPVIIEQRYVRKK